MPEILNLEFKVRLDKIQKITPSSLRVPLFIHNKAWPNLITNNII